MTNHDIEDPRFDAPLFKDVGTFMGVPASRDLSHAKAAVLGIPFDCGLHPVRLGARLGPAEIRRQSSLVRPYQPPLWQVNLLEELGVVDCGDVNVVLGDVVESYRRIEAALDALFDAGAVPITFGGDGAVTLPQLRAAHRRHPELVVLHFDAHTDTYADGPAGATAGSNYKDYNPSTTFTPGRGGRARRRRPLAARRAARHRDRRHGVRAHPRQGLRARHRRRDRPHGRRSAVGARP